jgi:predicted FMN-binding regulatory protein PaiB
MVSGPNKYPPLDAQHVSQLIERHPLAWIVSCNDGDFTVTPLPLRPRLHASGAVTHFAGHFARSNPHVEVLKRHPRALILFRGEESYVSPSWMSDRTFAPTWNHMGAQFVVDFEFHENVELLREVLRDMIDTMEAGRPMAWRLEETAHRYEKLVPHIVSFDAHVRETKAVFKLGQDERPAIYQDMLAGLANAGETELVAWMQRYNEHRQR